MSLGLSWAHILGDVFSASAFINMWGQIIGGNNLPPQPPKSPNNGKYQLPLFSRNPFSLKRVDPVGDYWITPNTCKMETHSFHFTSKQLNHLLFNTYGLSQTGKNKIMPFEFLSAIMWKSLAKIRGKLEPKIVTICRNNSLDMGNEIPGNRQVVSTIETDSNVANADIFELAKLIGEKKVDETQMIKDLIERENGNLDFIVYGANLTFVNLEESRIYELELKGFKTIYANYTIDGVGDEGVVLILPNLENGEKGGRNVTVVLPEYQLVELKNELKELGIN